MHGEEPQVICYLDTNNIFSYDLDENVIYENSESMICDLNK